ncbi:MAG: hypothetical protein WBB01_23270 [Phormidesmis sp.]
MREDGEQLTESQSAVGVEAVRADAIANSELEPAIQHCSERESVFRRTALERFVFEHQLGQSSFDELQQAIEGSDELVRIDESRVTTQAAIHLELETIRLMRAGLGQVNEIAPLSQVDEWLAHSRAAAGNSAGNEYTRIRGWHGKGRRVWGRLMRSMR